MQPIVFINCAKYPFMEKILTGRKVFETRNRNTLGSLIGERVLLAETGKGKPLVRGSATIDYYITVTDRKSWKFYQRIASIQTGSDYDWKPWTKKKVLYHLADIQTCDPFFPPEDIRHGRVWMEYNT